MRGVPPFTPEEGSPTIQAPNRVDQSSTSHPELPAEFSQLTLPARDVVNIRTTGGEPRDGAIFDETCKKVAEISKKSKPTTPCNRLFSKIWASFWLCVIA